MSFHSLLQDLRNYQYSLSMVGGLRIHMEMGHSYIDIPKGSFSEVVEHKNIFQYTEKSTQPFVMSLQVTSGLPQEADIFCRSLYTKG